MSSGVLNKLKFFELFFSYFISLVQAWCYESMLTFQLCIQTGVFSWCFKFLIWKYTDWHTFLISSLTYWNQDIPRFLTSVEAEMVEFCFEHFLDNTKSISFSFIIIQFKFVNCHPWFNLLDIQSLIFSRAKISFKGSLTLTQEWFIYLKAFFRETDLWVTRKWFYGHDGKKCNIIRKISIKLTHPPNLPKGPLSVTKWAKNEVLVGGFRG